MTDQPFNHDLVFKNPLVSSEDFLVKFAECSLFTFSAKDIKTRKIFIYNKVCADLYGLGDTGLAGMTSRDCLEHVKPFAQREDALVRWEQEEVKAVTNNAAQTNIITILDYSGFVRIREHLTIPVCGSNKQVVAIAAFCYDRTKHIDLLNLFKRYQKYYSKAQAIIQFSKYLELHKSFQCKLTTGELYVLLALVQAPRHKQAAYLLSAFREKSIVSTTVSGYVERIRDKLKPKLDLEMVLTYLRGLTQWTLDPNIS